MPARFGQPKIFNADQDSQFTSAAFTDRLAAAGMRILMDGREARIGIGAWIASYNAWRSHEALGDRSLMAVWRAATTGTCAGTAVDMTLRLDNARALPTCPQLP